MTALAEEVTPLVPLRRNREFGLLWVGQALSGFGSALSNIAMPLAVLAAGYPASVAAAIGTASLITGQVVRIPAGYLADRFDQRRTMLYCDAVRGLLVAVVAVAAWHSGVPIALALATVVLSQVAVEAFRPAQNKVVRRVVPPEQMGTAISVNQVRGYTAEIVAPAAAGLLLTAGTALPFAVDAVTFLASGLCVLALRRGLVAGTVARPEPGRFRAELFAGLAHLRRDPFLLRATCYFSLLNTCSSAVLYLVILGLGSGAGGPLAVGTAMSGAAVAGLLGSLLAPVARRRLRFGTVITFGPSLGALLLGTSWLLDSPVLLGAAFAGMCLLSPMTGALLNTVLALVVPEEIYGRVGTAVSFVGQLLQPTGPLIAGFLLTYAGRVPATGLLACALACLVLLTLAVPAPVTERR